MKKLFSLLLLLSGCYPNSLTGRVAVIQGGGTACALPMRWVAGLLLLAIFLIGLCYYMAIRLLKKS